MSKDLQHVNGSSHRDRQRSRQPGESCRCVSFSYSWIVSSGAQIHVIPCKIHILCMFSMGICSNAKCSHTWGRVCIEPSSIRPQRWTPQNRSLFIVPLFSPHFHHFGKLTQKNSNQVFQVAILGKCDYNIGDS